MLIELDPVDRITAGAVGPAGERVFYLQGRRGDQLITVLVEKQQVQLLSASVVEILARIGKETGQGPSEELMELDEPIIPEWRAGRISIGYHDERDLLMLEAEELLPEEEQEDEGGEGPGGGTGPLPETPRAEDPPLARQPEAPEGEAPEPQRVRFWATREQMLSLARHGAAVCAAGRPRCQLCGNPIDPEGHQCPALNGQGGSTEA
ncbi:MAG: DUF3090 family protein [Actinomycetota bacterium]